MSARTRDAQGNPMQTYASKPNKLTQLGRARAVIAAMAKWTRHRGYGWRYHWAIQNRPGV